MRLSAAIPVIALVCLSSPAGAQKVTRPPKAPAEAHPNVSAKPLPPSASKKSPEAPSASPQYLDRLLKLTPEQRNKALGSLPPQRRALILSKLEDYQKLPPELRQRELDRLQRLQQLPPQKRAQVRNSLRQFQAVPQPRHRQMQQQINQLAALPEPDRRALMNSEEFRSKYTPAEQQIIEDVSLLEAKR
jgi:phage-related protein